MEKIKLGDLCNPCQGQIKVQPGTIIDYIDISSIDNNCKTVSGYQTMTFAEAPSRARKAVKKGNILVSTVRPNLNAVAIVEDATPNTTVASTGFCVLDCKENVDKRFVFNFCKSKAFIDEMVAQATGASYPAVSDKIVRTALIPSYSFHDQIKIGEILDKVSLIIAKRKSELTYLDNLVKARFVEMFGDPVSNPKGWEKKALSDEAEIKIGPFGSLLHKEDYIAGGHALVNPSHIVDGKILPDDKLTVSDEKYDELSAYHLRIGDVVMGRRGEMGRCAVVEQVGLLCGTGSLLIRTNGDLSADYIQKIISFPSFKRTIEDMAVGQTMSNLNVPIVSSFQIIKPPKSVQDQYYAFVAQVDKSKAVIQKSLEEAQLLFDSLMQQYFG